MKKEGVEQKKEISLVISDVDNTVIDYWNTWGKTTQKAFESLCESRGISMDVLKKDVFENTHPETRMHDLPEMIKTAPVLQPKNDEEKAKFEKDDAKIIHEWNKGRDASPLYEGVIATARKAKAAGAKFVLYSDALEQSVITRMAVAGFPADLIDGVYSQPAINLKGEIVPPKLVKGKITEFRKQLGDKVVTLGPDSRKPAPDTIKRIMNDMGVTETDKVVMVGDNLHSDCGGGNMAGVNSAWQKAGCDVDKETVELYFSMPSNPDYALGLKRMEKQLKDKINRPDYVLEEGFKDLNKHFKFVSAEADKSKKINLVKTALDKSR